EAAQAAQDVARAHRLSGDLAHRRADVIEVGGRPAEEPVARLSVVRDRGERLIELVRDARRHLPDGREARHLQHPSMHDASGYAWGIAVEERSGGSLRGGWWELAGGRARVRHEVYYGAEIRCRSMPLGHRRCKAGGAV